VRSVPGLPVHPHDWVVGGRFILRLGSLLRSPIEHQPALEEVRLRLQRREADFLALVRRTVFDNPTSPYLKLLKLAGCEYGDLEELVWGDGVEGALARLYRAGVYLTVNELKGRTPAVRGSGVVHVDPGLVRNPSSAVHVLAETSGSSGPSTPVPIDLANIRERAVNTRLVLDARGGESWTKAVWGVPGRSAATVIRFSAFGAPTARWFLSVDPAAPGLHARYRWSAPALRVGGILAGKTMPSPVIAPVDDPMPVVGWLADVRATGHTPHLWSFVTPAVRLSQAALSAGLDLEGVRLTITGEPVTQARLEAIERAGGEAVPDYGSADAGGFVSYGCLTPQSPGDVHFFSDLHALIQVPPDAARDDLPAGALLISSLRPTVPYILLNASLGDRAVVSNFSCGCPLDVPGWRTHLREIRSFQRLTAGGMTFLDADVIAVLEQVLPARFGGTPIDYQLLEQEEQSGLARVRLLIHPAVGPLDEQAIVATFLDGLGRGSGAALIMAQQWKQAGVVCVERRPPLATPSGKILHFARDE
jgi:hypothetical protein